MKVLYSFPHRIGANRICKTAWQQVNGILENDVYSIDLEVYCGSVAKSWRKQVSVRTSLARGTLRFPIRLIGSYLACVYHDRVTAKYLLKVRNKPDLIHTWPLGALKTIQVARRFGIPVVLERPNSFTPNATRVVAEEHQMLGIPMSASNTHLERSRRIDRELREYETASFLLCPSEFVKQTFIDAGYPSEKLLLHTYGFDQNFASEPEVPAINEGLIAVYAGVCEPRKGLHYALKAWNASGISRRGRFLICGKFESGYREALGELLNGPGVEVLGYRDDLHEIMRSAHLFVLSSVEEGSALVTYEARGAGCVLLVSDATGAVVSHGENGLVHPRREWQQLKQQFDVVEADRSFLRKLAVESSKTACQLTWKNAGARLVDLYREIVATSKTQKSVF